VSSLPLAFDKETAWITGFKLMQQVFDAARKLKPHQLAASARMTELMIPEAIGLDEETSAKIRTAYRRHEELFVEAWNRIAGEQLNSQAWNFLEQENSAGKITLPRFPRRDSEAPPYAGTILLRRVTVPKNDPIADVVNKVLRRFTTLVFGEQGYPELARCPLLTLRFISEGIFILENDAGDDRTLDFAPILAGLRRAEISAREDLTLEEKEYALSDEALLRDRQAEYAIGKPSLVRMTANGMKLGNGLDGGDTPLPFDNESIWANIINTIEATRVELTSLTAGEIR